MDKIIEEDLKTITSIDLPWEDLRNKKILVTGGWWFLAAYLIKSLIVASREKQLNIKIICVSRSTPESQLRLSDYFDSPDISFLQHDIVNPLPDDIGNLDIIIHSASQASPKYYGTDPVGTLLPNSVGTVNLLNYAVKCNLEKFMFFSTGEIYGTPNDPTQQIEEWNYGYLDPMNVRSCYAESKRMGEVMCVSWGQQYNIHTVIVRPFHTYGPGISFDDGRVFADFVADAVLGRDIVIRSDGLAQRSFCYISDATIGFLTVLLKGDRGEAYNIGNPEAEMSIRELAETISWLFPERNIMVRTEILADNKLYLKSPINRLRPSIEKSKRLNWSPSVGIKEGFRRTIQSFL